MESMGKPLPMDKMSPKLLEALDKVFRSLPKPIQEALEAEARKLMEEIEDAMVEEFSGKLEENPAETHKEFKEKVEEGKKEKEKKLEKAKLDEEMRDIGRIQAAMESSKGVYDTTYAEIRELDERLYKLLEEVFTPNIKRKMRLKSAGSKLNLPAVFRWEGGRQSGARGLDSRIFETVHIPEKKDYAITLLNDLSGSMVGEKIEQDFKAKVLLTEVLNRLGIKNEILGFQDEVIIFKRFDEDLSDDVRKRISGMPYEVSGLNPGGHNMGMFNDDGPCLLEASRSLSAQSSKEKFLIVISDGMPAGRFSNAHDLKRAVDHILTTTDQKLVGLGLGEDTEHVKSFYPTALPNITVEELVETVGGLLEDMILNPQKYAYNKDG